MLNGLEYIFNGSVNKLRTVLITFFTNCLFHAGKLAYVRNPHFLCLIQILICVTIIEEM